jgi:hypothetical protein
MEEELKEMTTRGIPTGQPFEVHVGTRMIFRGTNRVLALEIFKEQRGKRKEAVTLRVNGKVEEEWFPERTE